MRLSGVIIADKPVCYTRNDINIPYVEEGAYYILTVDRSATTLEKLKKNAEPQTQKTIMNAAQRLIQQGMQQGMQQGIQARSLEIARTMFQAGEPIERVARWTGLSEASIRSL